MTYIKNADIEYEPNTVNTVLQMNKQFEDLNLAQTHGDSPSKKFGLPMPGDPSIMFTIQKNQLSELQQRYAKTVELVQGMSVSSSGREGMTMSTGGRGNAKTYLGNANGEAYLTGHF